MLWPEEDHPVEGRVAAVGVVHLLGLEQRFAQAGGGDRDRHAGRIHVEQELVLLLDLRDCEAAR